MNHQFCIQCGAKNLYQSSVPKFCCGCGKPFNRIQDNEESFASQEEEEVIEKELTIDKSKLAQGWVADMGYSQNKMTIGDLINSPAERSEARISRPRPKSLGENIVKQTMLECSPVKQSKELGN
jgi:hypothetical protein